MNHLSHSAYDPLTGYAVKYIPLKLFKILDNLVSHHLNLERTIGSYASSDSEILLDSLNQLSLSSRNSRTLPKNASKKVNNAIIQELSAIMPTPKRIHNNDIYFRVVIASNKNTISIPHRDEYFHRITPGWDFENNEESIKVWIPLFCPSGIALGIVPGSHTDYSHGNATYLLHDGAYQFRSPHQTSDLIPVRVATKQCLVFPSMLIHGSLSGEVIDPLRISVEISPVLTK